MDGLLEGRMEEAQGVGVEPGTVVLDEGFFQGMLVGTEAFEAAVEVAVVGIVADDGVADVFAVNADLVGAAGFETATNEGELTGAAKDGEVAPGVTCMGTVNFAVEAVGGVHANGSIDGGFAPFGVTNNDGKVLTFDGALDELVGEGFHGLVVLGNNHQAGGIPVYTVNDPRAPGAVDSGKIREKVQEGVDEGSIGIACGGVNDKPGLFVDDNDVIVVMDNVEGDVLGPRPVVIRRWPVDSDFFAFPDCMDPFRRGAVDEDLAVLDELLNAISGGRSREAGQPGIKAHPDRFIGGD